MNQLTFPQMKALYSQLQKYPPTNFILAEVIEGLLAGHERQQQESELQNMPNVITEQPEEKPKALFSPSGSRIVKMIVKKTGRQVI